MLDWDLIRYFLAVARAGTLVGAARELGVDQTTVGRRVVAFEERVGVRLFERGGSGYALTDAGARVFASAEAMASAASDVEARALGEDTRLTGTVRIATTETLAEHFVVRAVATVRAEHPAVDMVVATGWRAVSLVRREADVAVRLPRPTDPRLVGRRAATFAMRLYAAPSYVSARGEPRCGLAGHDLIAYEEATAQSSREPFAGASIEGARVVFQGNSATVLVHAAEAGLGVVELPSYVGDARPGLARVLPERERPYGVWMVVHRDARRAARVRAVCDGIAAAFGAYRRRGR